jgi:hypothetical protein
VSPQFQGASLLATALMSRSYFRHGIALMSPYMRYGRSQRATVYLAGEEVLTTLSQNILYSVIENIASLWPEGAERQRYQAAATNFRIPYWDWAANPPAGESVLPRSIGGNQFIDVDGPNGVQRIANPLYNYQFKPLDTSDFLNMKPVGEHLNSCQLSRADLAVLPVGSLGHHRQGSYE